jgi:voltage-gated potassium channel
MQSDERLRRIEQATDLPLLILSLVLIPILLAPILFSPSAVIDRTLLTLDWTIWAVFAVDFGLKVTVAPQRLRYVRSHWLEVAMVALPFLRPLRGARVLRVLRGTRVAVALGENLSLLRRIANERGLQLVVAAVMVVGVVGAFLVLLAERNADGSNIHTFGDALWWAVSTMTTVGYGDRFPVTPTGRGLAVALMLTGVTAMTALTASVAAFLIRESAATSGATSLDDVRDELRALRSEIAALRGTPESLPLTDDVATSSTE